MMMKYILLTILLPIFLLQTFSNLVLVSQFELNSEFFTELCEKKSEPVNSCNGSCHLRQQFEQQDEKEEQTPYNLQHDRIDIQLFNHFNRLTDSFNQNFRLTTYLPYITGKVISIALPIDHPPQ